MSETPKQLCICLGPVACIDFKCFYANLQTDMSSDQTKETFNVSIGILRLSERPRRRQKFFPRPIKIQGFVNVTKSVMDHIHDRMQHLRAEIGGEYVRTVTPNDTGACLYQYQVISVMKEGDKFQEKLPLFDELVDVIKKTHSL